MNLQVLSGIVVLDLTNYIAGPFCSKLLADFGADVIKIERPGIGDLARQFGPFPNDIPDTEKSGLFLYLNANKRGISLNLKTNTGKKMLKELISKADILIENFSPRVMPSLGLDFETLKKVNPNLIMTSISNFGQTGPYRDWKANEISFMALSGLMYKRGEPEREPLKHALNVSQYHAGKIASVITLAALMRNKISGGCEHIDVSILEAITADPNNWIYYYSYSKDKGTRTTGKSYKLYPFGAFPAKDGYVSIQGIGGR